MQLKYIHLADYAGDGANGKPIIVGIFDQVFVLPPRPIGLPPFYLAGALEASVAEGSQQDLEVRFADGNGNNVIPRVKLQIKFHQRGPRRLMRAHFAFQFVGIQLNDVGDFAFHLFDSRAAEIGEAPLIITPAPGIR